MKTIIIKRNEDLCERYNVLNKQGENHESIKRILSKEFELGESYIMSILYDYGVSKLDNRNMGERDVQIISLYLDGVSRSVIGKRVGLTATRVSQIVKKHLGDKSKKIILGKHLYKVKSDVDNGLTHPEILEKYGSSLLRKLKISFGYNPFDHYIDRRNTEIVQLIKDGKEALEIAEKYNLTRDHIYGISHEYGIRKKPTKEEYEKRNKKILKKHIAGVTTKDLSSEFDLGITNINIIIKNMKKKAKA